jgi:ABC-2 type transport system ATP-binding protein
MIEARDLTKIYAGKAAVDHLTFTVEPGQVTGFLGPNGAGKSTTMRLILGLDRPQSGIALINGRRYRDLKDPLRTVGALLEAKTVHPGVRRLHRADRLADRNALVRPEGRGPGRQGPRRPGRLHPGHGGRARAARHPVLR